MPESNCKTLNNWSCTYLCKSENRMLCKEQLNNTSKILLMIQLFEVSTYLSLSYEFMIIISCNNAHFSWDQFVSETLHSHWNVVLILLNNYMTYECENCLNQTTKPLHKDAGLHCMDNAAEAGLVFAAVHHQGLLPGEGGGQPVTDLWRHRVWLDVTQLILWFRRPPGRERFTKKKSHSESTVSVVVDRWCYFLWKANVWCQHELSC